MYEKAVLVAPDYAGDPHLVIFLCLVVVFNILVIFETAFLLGMGNEGSQLSSEGSTPLSEYQSMYSYSVGPRTRSSAPSTRAPSPVEPPEPDLSHLTPEEIAQIKEVMDRAKNMQSDDQRRARQLEEEYIEYATKMEREASLSELSDNSTSLCPVCNKVDVINSDDISKSGPYVCADCGKVTCATCGLFDRSLTSNAQEWVCVVCQRRRKLIMSTGLWYHGSHPESELPLERELNGESGSIVEDVGSRDHFQMMPSGIDPMSYESHSELRPSNICLPETTEPQNNGPKMDWSFDSSQPTSSQSSFEMIPHKPSKLRGTGGVSTLSDPEDYSDFTFEDYDMGDFASKGLPNQEKAPSEEESPIADIPDELEGGPKLRRKHRPRSLNLTRSHSLTSPDEDSDGGQSGESSGPAVLTAKSPEHLTPEELPSQMRNDPLHDSKFLCELNALEPPDMINKTMSSPTPPRSPSWREGLESPPFSPKRKDSYPGKRRGSPVSPKDKRLHFTYTDISPPSRQLSLDELYGDGQCSTKDNSFFGMHMGQKPSPVSPDEVRNTLMSALGEPLQFEMPTRDKLQTFSVPCVQHLGSSEDVSMDSAPVMDVATYAATIASSTASLTSMSVSPTNLSVSSSYDSEQVSPESMGSTDSSPVSPGYYDNTTPEDMEDVELADPSTKSIDYQGSKRQKARPPTTDWSPVIDLSPILDVSPSVEEAEQEDMLAKQLEEFERQQSLTEGLDRDDENGESGDVSDKSDKSSKDSNEEDLSYQGLKRYDIMEDISRIDGTGLHEVKVVECNGTQNNIDEENGNILFENEDDGDSLLLICTSVAQPQLPTSSSSCYSSSSMGSSPRHVSDIRTSMSQSQVESDTNSEFRKINNDLQDILKSGAVDVKPIPPPKPRRKLPDPSDILDSVYSEHDRSLPAIPVKSQEFDADEETAKLLLELSKPIISTTKILPRQDSTEKRKAKDLKAKPNPLLIQHIETEEQSVSPHYKILDSPPTPEQKSVRREFSESTSVSPSSSPDRDMYMFPSPVTPPDSDSSPPKPQSPSSPGTDEDIVGKMPVRTLSFGSNLNGIADEVKATPSSTEMSESLSSVRDRIKAFEQIATHPCEKEPEKPAVKESKKDTHKVRRRLPAIPMGEPPVLTPKAKLKATKPVKPKPAEKPKLHSDKKPVSSQSDDSMNEDDMEVARINKIEDKRKPLVDTRKAKSLDASDNVPRDQPAIQSGEKLKLQRASSVGSTPKEESDAIIDSLINIYGIPCTEAMKSLKKRLQEELRRVTRDRRRKLEELEEIRALQMQIGSLKLEADMYAGRHGLRQRNGRRSPASIQLEQELRKRSGGSSPASSLTPRSSPQVTPRRQRHKRQSSDPMIAKFSPIKEDRDIEADFHARISDNSENKQSSKYSTDDSSQSGVSDTESTRSEPVENSRYKKIKPSAYARMFYNGITSSSERLGPDIGPVSGHVPLESSRSESQLIGGNRSGSRTPNYYSDNDEGKSKEEKKARLQYEIDKRKRQLKETARLKSELIRLARARQAMIHSYDDIPRSYEPVCYGQKRSIPTGIIRPLDDDPGYDVYGGDECYIYKDPQDRQSGYSTNSNYSSTEYLAHRQENCWHQRSDEPIYVNQQQLCREYIESTSFVEQPHVPKRMDSYPSVATMEPTYVNTSRDPRIPSSVTLPDMHSNRKDMDFVPGRELITMNTFSDTSSPASDYTPAMPLLGDVPTKSRTILHNIGSGGRPVSAEFNFPGGVEDLMNPVYRAESDNSVDADEPIMKHMTEGGVTILKQLDRKKRPAPPEPPKYGFPTKRILITRDPKDRPLSGRKGNGIGMKIVGGKEIPGTDEIGAYVATIYPGVIADQLHGELDIGDQVLEWNGIPLSGKTYEEVQQIITQPNGEIEMVVRPLSRSHKGREHISVSCAQPTSCHSSYDNLAKDPPPYEDLDCRSGSRQGVDPRQLAAQLEEIKEIASPENSPSSQQEFLTPSMPSPCSTPRSDPASSSSSHRQRVHVIQIEPNSSFSRQQAVGGQSSSKTSQQKSMKGMTNHQGASGSVSVPPSVSREDNSVNKFGSDKTEQSISTNSDHEAVFEKVSPSARRRSRPVNGDPPPSQKSKSRSSNLTPDQCVKRVDNNEDFDIMQYESPRSKRKEIQNSSFREKRQTPDDNDQNVQLQTKHKARSHSCRVPRSKQEKGDPISKDDQCISSSKIERQQKPTTSPRVPATGGLSSPQQVPKVKEPIVEVHPKPTPRRRAASRADPEVATPIKDNERKGESSASAGLRPPSHDGATANNNAPKQKRSGSTKKNDRRRQVNTEENDFSPADPKSPGDVQIQISHDEFDNTLNVHVIQARNLRPRDINGLSDPFVKVYLLPGRGQENKRRTKHISRTLNPQWHQTLMFQNVARMELQNKVLELTVWDYDRFKTNDFLGELILELSEDAFLDNRTHWYPLRERVVTHSFELPKSSVPPPRIIPGASESCSDDIPLGKSPRPPKKTKRQVGSEDSSKTEPRRGSLGTLDQTSKPAPPVGSQRIVSSATNSPAPRRKPRDSRSPNKRPDDHLAESGMLPKDLNVWEKFLRKAINIIIIDFVNKATE